MKHSAREKEFLGRNFLLETETARNLFHYAAKNEPIYDFHCHLIPAEIAENKRFANLTDVWLGGDHYKWRMMRAYGFDEARITGSAEPYEKFLAWAETIEACIGNPLYVWTHLELRRYFGIDDVLSRKTAASIWERANARLATPELSVKGIFERFKVYAVNTTDDPVDSLEHHRAIAAGSAPIGKISTAVNPTFRPDKALNINLPGFAGYIDTLSNASGLRIQSVSDVIEALAKRLEFFVAQGCRVSDHGLEYVPFALAKDEDIDQTFKDALIGKIPGPAEADAYRTRLLTALAGLYTRHNIAMQLHIGALRNASSLMAKTLGPDIGNDAVHDYQAGGNLAALLSHIEAAGELPKTVLYSLNPKDYYPLATIMGCFQDSRNSGQGIRGKMQLGTSWWFCDHKDGMEEQMHVLADVGLFSAFIGMLTDSRSFLSYPRHEYFRRVLCNLIGTWVESGEYPSDEEQLSTIVRNISFGNARVYFS
jgi:glucuronate isomerase